MIGIGLAPPIASYFQLLLCKAVHVSNFFCSTLNVLLTISLQKKMRSSIADEHALEFLTEGIRDSKMETQSTSIAGLQNMHLQWFAAEDEGRTEAPTERKIRKAREEGKVARSADLPAAVVFVFVLVLLGALGGQILEVFIDMFRYFYGRASELDITNTSQILERSLSYFLRITIPLGSIAVVAALFGNIIQVGFLFSVKAITPSLKKIVPKFGEYFKKILFSREGVYNQFRLSGKILIIGAICYINIQSNLELFEQFMFQPFQNVFFRTATLTFITLLEAAIALLVLSIVDYAFQRYQHAEQLRMTREEVKEERKSEEGDPLVRSRLRQRMRELLNRSSLERVPKADVVVTNPTHYSVALEYDNSRMTAPAVCAKGVDMLALRIRQIAGDNDVPIIENKPLARGLYHDVDIGDTIPEQYYEAMVIVLREVYQMRGQNNG